MDGSRVSIEKREQVIGCGECDRILNIVQFPGLSQFVCPEHGLIANLMYPEEDSND
jgi:hypothetical protein